MSTAGYVKYLLIRWDAATKCKLDLMETDSTVGGSSNVVEIDAKSVEKPAIDQCIGPAPPVPKISVKLPKNLAKDGGALLSVLKNYPEIEIAGMPDNAVSVAGEKLGSITRIVKQMYSKTAQKPDGLQNTFFFTFDI